MRHSCSGVSLAVQLLAVIGLSTGLAAPAIGQVSVSPTVGVYAPTANLIDALVDGTPLQLKQQVGIALGGRLGIGLGSRISLSATGSYVPSSLRATISSTGAVQEADDRTSLYFGSGRLNLWLLPRSSPLVLGLNGGVGVVGRSSTVVTDANGDTYTDGKRTDVGGVVGATLGLNLGVISAFVAADNYIYKPTVFEQLGVERQTQNDVQISFGLGLPLGGSRTK